MRWLSIDPATFTGIARWEGDKLACVGSLRPITTKKEAKVVGSVKGGLVIDTLDTLSLFGERSPKAFASPLLAWSALLADVSAVVIEEAMGFSAKSVAQLGVRRGYIRALCETRQVPWHEINLKEWQRVAGEMLNVSWPNNSEKGKQLSIDLVAEHYGGLVVSDDEGDAIWLGRAAMRMRTVRAMSATTAQGA